jgi:EAL domain-containing protein (putative c-di-GMP-specific phosphodiesterase class I)
MRELAAADIPYQPPLAMIGNLDKTVDRTLHALARALDYPLAGSIGNPLHNTGLAHIFENLPTTKAVAGGSNGIQALGDGAFNLQDILTGLAQNQFEAWFQPQLAARTLNLYGVEALARWHHPQAGIIGPEHFVPILEQAGHIHLLTDTIAHKTVAALAQFAEHGIDTRASINLSLADLDHYELVKRLQELTEEYGVANRRITVELRESAHIRDLAQTLETLSRLRLQGFGLALDHFGVGHSSIHNLDILPASELKIDASYIADMHRNSIHRKLLKSFVDLGRHVGASVIAEGVESKQQAKYLTQIGCTALQGFYIDEPMQTEQLILSYGCIAA